MNQKAGLSTQAIIKRLGAQSKQEIPEKAIDFHAIVLLANAINQLEAEELQARLSQLLQLEQADREQLARAQSHSAQRQQKQQALDAQKSRLNKQRELLENEINSLEAMRRVFEVSDSKDDDKDFLQGDYFASLLAEVAEQDKQIEVDAGADKLSAHIHLLNESKRPAALSLAQYITRLAELDQELKGYNSEIASQSAIIGNLNHVIDNLNKEQARLASLSAQVRQKLDSHSSQLLLHSASLDSSLHLATQVFNRDYNEKVQAIQNTLSAAEKHYNDQKAGAEAHRNNRIEASHQELLRLINYAEANCLKTYHKRERYWVGCPKYVHRWRDVDYQGFDPDKFNAEKARLQEEHNGRVNQINADFNQALSAPNNAITQARVTANNNLSQLECARHAALTSKLDSVKNIHAAESLRLAAEVNRLKPLVDNADADVEQKLQEIATHILERGLHQNVLDQAQSHKSEVESRCAATNKEMKSIETRILEIDREICQAQQQLHNVSRGQAVAPGRAVTSFDSKKYEAILTQLREKHGELRAINQELLAIDTQLQQFNFQPVDIVEVGTASLNMLSIK